MHRGRPPNLGLKETPAALLGLACSAEAAERHFHRPWIPITHGKQPRTPILGLQGCVSFWGLAVLGVLSLLYRAHLPPKAGSGTGSRSESRLRVPFGTGVKAGYWGAFPLLRSRR